MRRAHNHRAGADAGFALLFGFGSHESGTARHERSTTMRA